MGYQALLFCPDEKLARIVAQVFSDLEFNVEPVQEPFSAVKKLMSQRYDALVVDCENESNASLLFKSARNSTSNQGTLAIAVVEGQAGVAKAYRIGANLVLTKPINVEQAKGTLRVARGLLRKNSEVHAAPASPAAQAATAPITPASISTRPEAPAQAPAVEPTNIPAVPAVPTPVSPKITRELPEFEPATPTIAASVAKAPVSFLEEVSNKQTPPVESPAPIMSVAPSEKTNAGSSLTVTGGASAGHGAAAAPAKVKEVIPPSTPTVELQPDPVLEGADSEPAGSTPSFSALDLDHSAASGGNKKILIAAAIVIAVAATGYFGWSKMGSHQTASPKVESVSTPQQSPTPTPVPTPVATAATATPVTATEHAGSASEPLSSKAALSIEPQKSANQARTQAPPEPEVKITNLVPPMKVKSGVQGKKSNDESNAAAPNPLAIADANTSALNSLVASAPSTSHPTLATLNISQGVSQGLLIKRVDPKYPPSALAMHIQGAVLLDATINREGMISNVKVVKGDKVLSRAAVDAVHQWRYKPYYLDGSPVEIQTQITINFKLPN